MNDPVIVKAIDTGPRGSVNDCVVDGIFCERDFRYGRIRYLASDYGVGQMLHLYGEYSEGEISLLRKILKAGDVVVSAGGNIGVHLIPISQIVGASGQVITFEPQSFIREKLLEVNLDMNACQNVMVHESALGADIGIARMPRVDYSAPNNFGGLEVGQEGEEEVSVMPLDALELERLDLLMLDVEGFELQALRGARATIMEHRPYLYVEIDREDKKEAIVAYMRSTLGYEVLYHTPMCFNPANFAGNADNPFGLMASFMAFGVPA